MMNALSMTILAMSTAALAGCAGGGGGGSTGGATSDSAAPTFQDVTVGVAAPSGAVVEANGTNNATTTGVAFGLNGAVATTGANAPGQVSAQITLNSAGGATLQVAAPSGVDTVSFMTPTIISGIKEFGPAQGTQNSGKYTYDLASFGQVAGLAYSDFGIWDRDLTSAVNKGLVSNDAIVSSYYRGAETPPANMPGTGSFTYNGKTAGESVNSSGGITAFAGDIALTANFLAATINGSVTGLRSSAGPLNLTGDLDGRISGNAFSGSGAAKENGSTVGTGGFSGKFYGPAAEEVAGQWNLEGSGVKAMGSFGAKR